MLMRWRKGGECKSVGRVWARGPIFGYDVTTANQIEASIQLASIGRFDWSYQSISCDYRRVDLTRAAQSMPDKIRRRFRLNRIKF